MTHKPFAPISRLISFVTIFCFTFSNVSFALPQNNLRQPTTEGIGSPDNLKREMDTVLGAQRHEIDHRSPDTGKGPAMDDGSSGTAVATHSILVIKDGDAPVVDALRERGFKVEHAWDTEQAVDWLLEGTMGIEFDVVIFDYDDVSRKDAVALLKRIKEQKPRIRTVSVYDRGWPHLRDELSTYTDLKLSYGGREPQLYPMVAQRVENFLKEPAPAGEAPATAVSTYGPQGIVDYLFKEFFDKSERPNDDTKRWVIETYEKDRETLDYSLLEIYNEIRKRADDVAAAKKDDQSVFEMRSFAYGITVAAEGRMAELLFEAHEIEGQPELFNEKLREAARLYLDVLKRHIQTASPVLGFLKDGYRLSWNEADNLYDKVLEIASKPDKSPQIASAPAAEEITAAEKEAAFVAQDFLKALEKWQETVNWADADIEGIEKITVDLPADYSEGEALLAGLKQRIGDKISVTVRLRGADNDIYEYYKNLNSQLNLGFTIQPVVSTMESSPEFAGSLLRQGLSNNERYLFVIEDADSLQLMRQEENLAALVRRTGLDNNVKVALVKKVAEDMVQPTDATPRILKDLLFGRKQIEVITPATITGEELRNELSSALAALRKA